MLLLGKTDRGVQKSYARVRTRIPKTKFTDAQFEFPRPPKPFNHRAKQFQVNLREKQARDEELSHPLKSKSSQHLVRVAAAIDRDPFSG